jgi:hypothetical protein
VIDILHERLEALRRFRMARATLPDAGTP